MSGPVAGPVGGPVGGPVTRGVAGSLGRGLERARLLAAGMLAGLAVLVPGGGAQARQLEPAAIAITTPAAPEARAGPDGGSSRTSLPQGLNPAVDFPVARAPDGARLPADGSDLAADPAIRFGILPNGLRYAIERRTAPAGQVSVRLRLAVGAIHEGENQLGYAHLVEHMAFNGSQAIPEGEMVARLERAGAAFGRDLNATVSDTETIFRIDLPASGGAGVGEALFILRETASRLTLSPEALAREKGVVLAEIGAATTPARAVAREAEIAATPDDLAARRAPLGTAASVAAATPESLRQFYRAWYRPDRAVLVVVGDVDPAAVEAMIRTGFADWGPALRGPPALPDNGSWPSTARTRSVVVPDPALPLQLTVRFLLPEEGSRGGLDTAARQGWWDGTRLLEDMLQARLGRAAAAPDAAFSSAGVRVERAANGWELRITVTPVAGRWPEGLEAVAGEIRAATLLGFSDDELAVARDGRRAQFERAVRVGPTLQAADRATAIMTDLARNQVTQTPQARLDGFVRGTAGLTPQTLQQRLAGFTGQVRPVIVLTGNPGPAGPLPGSAAARWDLAWDGPLDPALAARAPWQRPRFAAPLATDPGAVVSVETVAGPYPYTRVRFANGVLLVHRASRSTIGSVSIRVSVTGGALQLPADQPGLAALLEAGWQGAGLPELNGAEASAVFAGTSVRAGTVDIGMAVSTLTVAGIASSDTGLQLDLLLAQSRVRALSRPAIVTAAARIDAGWPAARASPDGLVRLYGSGLYLDGSDRFDAPDRARLAASAAEPVLAAGETAFGGWMASAPLTIAIVGDIDLDSAIRETARTFAALPPRATQAPARHWREVRNWRWRAPGAVRLTHDGPGGGQGGQGGQGLVGLAFPTPGEGDVQLARALSLLGRILQLRVSALIREQAGLSYTPLGGWQTLTPVSDHGRLFLQATGNPADLARIAALMEEIVHSLRDAPPTPDEIQRALGPMLEQRARQRQTNGFWLDRLSPEGLPQPPALRGPGLAALDASYDADLAAVTARDLHRLARRYLRMDRAVRVIVEPRVPALG